MQSNEKIINTAQGTVINIYTPFHLLQCIRLKDELRLNDSTTTVMYVGNYMNVSLLKEALPAARFIEILDAKFNIRNLRNAPLAYLKDCREKTRQLKAAIREIIAPYAADSFIRVIVFNDKDMASQLLITECKRKFRESEFVAVDEGTAFYVVEKKSAWLRRLAYRMVSGIILGENLEHIDRFGTHPDISVVYLRSLKLLPARKKGVNYREVPKTPLLPRPTHATVDRTHKTALMLTSPVIESRLLSAEKYHAVLDTIIQELLRQHYTVYVKQHPREETKHLQESAYAHQLIFLDGKTTAENLHFEDYDRIINFGSSVILDAIDRNYRASNIITVDILNFKSIKYIIDQTSVIRNQNIQEKLQLVLAEK